jgi:hypothetical protein
METKEPRLLEEEQKLYTGNITGMAYIRNSKGGTANLYFHIVCWINRLDNSTSVKYSVKAFESHWSDHEYFETTDYSAALEKYNELAIKWNGYRPFIASNNI